MLFLFVEGGAFGLIYTYMSLQVILLRVLKQKATGKQFVFWQFGNDLSQCIVNGFFLCQVQRQVRAICGDDMLQIVFRW